MLDFKFTYDTLNKIGDIYIAELTQQLLSADKDASGNLIDSLDYEVLKTVDGFLLELKAASYLRYVDKGRKPGKMPPTKDIEKWVKEKGIQFRSPKGRFITYKQTSFIIAKSIGENGIKATNVIDKTQQSIISRRDDLLLSAFNEDVKSIISEMVNKLKKK